MDSKRENRQKIILAGGTSREIPRCYSVLISDLASSVADQGCFFRIQNPKFSIPDPGSKRTLDPGSASKNISIFNPKILFKLSEI
jgi:hypothetical protein